MKRDSLAFAVSGVLFGLLVGWILGSQQSGAPVPAAPAPQAAVPAGGAASGTSQPPPFDAARAAELERQANADPKNAAVRTELGNLYFDAERYDRAITWYEAALQLDEKNVNVSTDLAVAYYYSNQADRALAQIDYSLKLDPRHLKTLLNQGIIRAFGKSDLAGAQRSWEQVVAIAPASEEGRRAQQGLDGLRSAHAADTAGGSGR
ncbi:MAG: tetratricopeptide repeat protein [Acidobacteria bacterium]|nr:tetratricopeptide repeat protein [Acidobacteriota bacterium]